MDTGLAAGREELHKTRYCRLTVATCGIEFPGWGLRVQLSVTREKEACESVCKCHGPRGPIAGIMECFATVFQKAVTSQGGMYHREGSRIVGGRSGNDIFVTERIGRNNLSQW